jgi:polysaccharide export outer membrane protein
MQVLHRLLLTAGLLFVCGFTDTTTTPKNVPGSYILGPNDQISVEVVELPEFNSKSYRIDQDGSVSLPLIGRIQAGGLTLTQFETQLVTRLKTQVLNPHLVVGLLETKSQPVSVMGAVNTPGSLQLAGQRTLFDVLAMAGGLKPDAGDEIKITRMRDEGELNVPNASQDPATGNFTAEVSVREVVELQDRKANILVRPHDEISVSRAQIVYVVGDVHKPGGFALSQRRTVSAMEALAMAEGPTTTANARAATVLRTPPDGGPVRKKIPIDMKKVMAGKAEDIQLQPNDVLFIPDNTSRRAVTRTAEVALATISGLIIFRGL